MPDAEAACWQCLADSCFEHDVEHERRALAALAQLRPRDGHAADETAVEQERR